MAHDACQQLGIGAGSEVAVLDRVRSGGFDRRPMRDPEGTDAGTLIEDLGNVAALFEDGHT